MNKLLKYDEFGQVIFDRETCYNYNPDSKYKFTDTESHAYLVVDAKEINSLNIQDAISEYSFTNGTEVWLEEDCDALIFIKAWISDNDKPFEFGMTYLTHSEFSEILEVSLERFKPETIEVVNF